MDNTDNKKTEQAMEKWLKESAFILKPAESPADVQPSKKHLDAFLQKIAEREASQEIHFLNRKEIEAMILHFLSEQGMEGLDLITCLESKKIRSQEQGEGVIYGILNQLEAGGLLESRWRESGSRMVKTYHLTGKGGDFLNKHSSVLSPYQAILSAS